MDTAKHILVLNLGDTHELYDLDEDPGEMINRFYDPDSADKARELFDALLDRARELDDVEANHMNPDIELTL